ncbi:TetR/AcrR family transcriptional regulator [Phytomonospora endophytica]|uniref:AcrR family transcriptional regulator n=1 Tax=Phytomonospora endophytica TaxID=714109 RepID=A0A841FYG0_9ACTN|nr:TetR/AcrR family transcriptional regulator [Phytomonospora endophytica]MBB6038387.1 AcrR family transcriptional regulator [Phytomonospora endophytica]GIG64318.1 TetR family transcriptional regulator [Phytomonospora endophytica]
MGTRDDLLVAAKKCLAERGYAKTTVRHIVAVSGTNLAAINYHFRTREALLHQAMVESVADAVDEIVRSIAVGDDLEPRLDFLWSRLTGSFVTERELWAANIEALAAALHSPELRARIAEDQQIARTELGGALGTGLDAEDRASLGAVVMTMLSGLLVQWMIDPDGAPTPERISAGLRALASG